MHVYSVYCAECGLSSFRDFGFRGDALFPLDEDGETDYAALEGEGIEGRRPSPGEAASHRFLQQCDRAIIVTQETAVQTEVTRYFRGL